MALQITSMYNVCWKVGKLIFEESHIRRREKNDVVIGLKGRGGGGLV